MPAIAQAAYRGTQYRSYGQAKWSFRPVANTSYPAGTILQLVAQDKQLFPDEATAQPCAAGQTSQLLCGVVDPAWPGFSGSISASTTSPNSIAAVYGTAYVEAIVKGFVPQILIDQSGTGAVTLTNGLPIVSSRNTAGYGQGIATATAVTGSAVIACAALPSSGIGSSITAAALAQASQTATVATPASGDTLNLTIQSPYTATSAGTAQTTTWSLTLNATTAASATTAAAAMVAYLNAQASFSQYFIATNSAGVITVTVNALANLFSVDYSGGIGAPGYAGVEANQFSISLSGMVANSLTFACTVTGSGGTTFTAGSTTFAGGTGFLGSLPAWVISEL